MAKKYDIHTPTPRRGQDVKKLKKEITELQVNNEKKSNWVLQNAPELYRRFMEETKRVY